MIQALFLTNSSSDSSKAQDYDTEGEELIDELRDLQPRDLRVFADSNNGKIAPQLFSAPNGRTVGSTLLSDHAANYDNITNSEELKKSQRQLDGRPATMTRRRYKKLPPDTDSLTR